MTAACFHCGLPVPEGLRFTARVDGEVRSMCCAGCVAVAELISGSGLAAYYRHREFPASGPVPGAATAEDYRIFDAPEACAGFVAPLDEGIHQVQLAIDGIRCAACTWLLERHIGALPAVQGIAVNLTESRAAVRWNPTELPLSALMSQIRALGYVPRPWIAAAQAEGLASEHRTLLRRLGVAGIVQMQIGMLALALYTGAFDGIEERWRDLLRWGSLALCLPVVFYSSTPFFVGAWRGVRNARPGMDLPIAVAIGLAFAASAWNTASGSGEVYYDSVAMFAFFLLLGRWLELRARRRAAMAGGSLLALLPASALRLNTDATRECIPVERLQPGQVVLVRTGEAFPADGRVLRGHGSVDESGLSGESLPQSREPGSRVYAGTVCSSGSFEVEVGSTGLQTRLGSILALADRAQLDKPRSVQLADRGASLFVIVVLLLAAASGAWWLQHEPERALHIALSVLVVSCPCALALATPVAHTAALNALRNRGFLVTRAHTLDALAAARLALFDKTGTLTVGRPCIERVQVLRGFDEASCRMAAAALESRSLHPLASAFACADAGDVADFIETSGAGVEGRVDGVRLRLGRPDHVFPGAVAPAADDAGSWILLADEHSPRAWFLVRDRIRDEASASIRRMRALGLRVELLSGDAEPEVARVARAVDADGWASACSPERKLEAVRRAEQQGQRTLVVGDGVNDVAVLAGAGLSIAVSGAADISRASADCMLLSEDLGLIPDAIAIARRAQRIVVQNLSWALAYNLLAIPFAAAGWVPPWLAAIGMSASSIVVVANALRLGKDGAARA